MEEWKYFDRVVILSTPKYNERILKLSKHLENIGLNDFIVELSSDIVPELSANKGLDNMSFWDMLVFSDKAHNNVSIDIGFSHYKVISKAYEENVKQLLILEDDAEFELPFDQKKLLSIIEWLKVNEWDIFYFGQFPYPNPFFIPVSFNGIFRIFHNTSEHSYVLNQTGMKKFLDVYKYGDNLDWVMATLPLKKYAIIPSMCYQNVNPGLYNRAWKNMGFSERYIPTFRNWCRFHNGVGLCISLVIIPILISYFI